MRNNCPFAILGMIMVLLTSAPLYATVKEPPAHLENTIESVSMFKNGLALVKRRAVLPSDGTFALNDIPQPIHGTFWVQSETPVEVRTTYEELSHPLNHTGDGSLPKALAGTEALIHFRDPALPEIQGRVRNVAGLPQSGLQHLAIDTSDGRIYVDTSLIAYARIIKERPRTTRIERKPVLLVTGNAQRITLSYVAKGIGWAASYRIDLSNTDQLRIEQKATIKNELANLSNTDMFLISGFPSIEFSNVISRISTSSSWDSFLAQLNGRIQAHGNAWGAATQMVTLNSFAPAQTQTDSAPMPAGEGADLYYFPGGKHSLEKGDTLTFTTGTEQTDYQRLVEWTVPDDRDATGHIYQDYERQKNLGQFDEEPWDAIRFRNPFNFPMTTAPVMVVSDGRFQGQRMSYWVSQNEMTTLRITKALNIRTHNTEQEDEGSRVAINTHRFRTSVSGKLSVANHRAETVTITIWRRFSGELIDADGEPTCTLLKEGLASLNKRNKLIWTFELAPGEKRELNYRYAVLVRT